jgi:hypothetical protein
MSNPNNNMNVYKQALQINRDLKKENDLLKEEIESLWVDLTGCEKRIGELIKRLGKEQLNEN